MIGSIEALGVFLLAILPGFVALRTYSYRRAPLRARGALGELGGAIVVSFVGWTGLYLWRGNELLPAVLSGDESPHVADRLDAFAELVVLSVAIGAALGIAGRCLERATRAFVRSSLATDAKRSGRRHRMAVAGQKLILPAAAWDRLLTRLSNENKPVVCRITTVEGEVVRGVLAADGYADWSADGRDLLLTEMVPTKDGKLVPLDGSPGLFVVGLQIATMRVAPYASAGGVGTRERKDKSHGGHR